MGSVAVRENEKRLAASHSLGLIQDKMVVGLGTGSTVAYLLLRLAEAVAAGLKIKAVATSVWTKESCERYGIDLIDYDGREKIDVTIDGADEISPGLQLIKGAGGALLREKIVAAASKTVVIIGDSSKVVSVLGRCALPVEVVPFGWRQAAGRIETFGCTLHLRIAKDGTAFLTDEGNYILDCSFGRIDDPHALAQQLDAIVGVVEHGLFLDLASQAVVAEGESVRIITR